MEVIIPRRFAYVLDRANFEQLMEINNTVFMLAHHADDPTDDFLSSDVFKRLHKNLVTATAKRWCNEIVVLKEITGEIPKKYNIDLQNLKALVEI